MRQAKHWSTPSLSRDFTILTGVIIFVLLLLSVWITWSTYHYQSERILNELEQEATRIDNTLNRELENTEYILRAMSRQLSQEKPDDLESIAKLLQAYNAHNSVFAMWAWVNRDLKLAVSSNIGILEEPVYVGDREHVQRTIDGPGEIQIGNPIHGRVSMRWVIPTGIGITDDTGRYIGSLTSSIDIQAIADELKLLVKRDGVSFAIVSKQFVKLTEVSNTPNFVDTYFPEHVLDRLNIQTNASGIVSQGSLFSKQAVYAYYQTSSRYPYVLLVAYDNTYSEGMIHNQLLPKLLQIGALAFFLLVFLWLVKSRILQPVVNLETITADIARGEPFSHTQPAGPMEIDALARQLAKVSDYIAERKRLERELHARIDDFIRARDAQKYGVQKLLEE